MAICKGHVLTKNLVTANSSLLGAVEKPIRILNNILL